MSREISSSKSSTSSPPSTLSEKDQLKFYKNYYEENHRRADKYKEKVDKHLKDLAADRHELQEELLRRGEKIADLQKALVELQLSVFEERERFLRVSAENEELKRNEQELHENIRQLLAMTNQKDLKDRIIYILKDPKVEIRQRTGTSKLKPAPEITPNQKLKEELNNLKHQLDEVLKISKSKSDIVLEDCKQALEKSKTAIMQDGVQIKELQKKLQEERIKNSTAAAKSSFMERQRSVPISKSISSERQRSVPISKSISSERQSSQTVPKAVKSVSWENPQHSAASKSILKGRQSSSQSSIDTEVLSSLCSQLKDIHLSLILLTKVIPRVRDNLNSIHATKLYYRFAKIPKVPTDLQHYVDEDTIHQLETTLRQCTRLTYDISNMYKSLCKFVTLNKDKIERISGLKSELKRLEKPIREMTAVTADSDLLNVGLRRADFFRALTDFPVVIPEENRVHCLEDFKKIGSNCETLFQIVSEVTDFVESVVETYSLKRDFYDVADSIRDFSYLSSETHSDISQDKFAARSASDEAVQQGKSKSYQDLIGCYKRIAQDSKEMGLSTETWAKKIKAAEQKLQEEEVNTYNKEQIMESEFVQTEPISFNHEDILRSINKTLSKVELLEQGRYFKDEEMCRKLVENVNALTEQFKQLNYEFSVKTVQEQFSEYSKVTLGKLEELAKQCRNSVIAAEAQISSHRLNAKTLSERLKETEDLLRESINECLSLKWKMKQVDAEHEMEKYTLISSLKEKLDQQTSERVEDIIDELVSNLPTYEAIKSTPYVCMYCRQGPGHKFCEEKIGDLQAECRKFKTELKLYKQDVDQEKSVLKHQHEVAKSSMTDLTQRNQVMQDSLNALEKKNRSLLEQLTVERNRIKRMERFHRLEIEGSKTDIKMLKAKLMDQEKKLMKAVLIFESNHKDIELLKTVHETAKRSEQTAAMIRRLKAKLYQLENELKGL